MFLSELNYRLPQALIAQTPASPRDHSRLMVIDKTTGKILHKHFYDLPDFLSPNDVLVFNQTKVFPARLYGKKKTGGKIEVLFLKNIANFSWEIITKPGIKSKEKIFFDNFECIIEKRNGKVATARFNLPYLDLLKALEKSGRTPLPPYIHSNEKESVLRKKYQTVYAKITGSAAAPTAGLHFTQSLLKKLKSKNIHIEFITLHVGLGTFEPVKENTVETHKIHEEYYEVDKSAWERLIKAKSEGKKIVAVGTTTTRVIETLSSQKSPNFTGTTNLYIYPPYKFKFVDALITNFHLPKSTLLALIYAFAGINLAQKAYQSAIKNKYRFFSFGDAMLIKN